MFRKAISVLVLNNKAYILLCLKQIIAYKKCSLMSVCSCSFIPQPGKHGNHIATSPSTHFYQRKEGSCQGQKQHTDSELLFNA